LRERSRARVSSVMTARNAERTIAIAVRSALHALPKDSELLVFLDDCSDQTENIVNKFGDSRLKIFSSNTNFGVADGRNFLISKAENDIIAVTDADDIYAPWRFRRGIAALRDRSVDFHFQQAVIVGRVGKMPYLLPQFPEKFNSQEANEALAQGNPFVHSSATFSKEAFLSIGGYRAVASEDYDLWLRASQAGFKLVKSGCYSVGYRVHATQLSQSPFWQTSVAADSSLDALKTTQSSRFLSGNVTFLAKNRLKVEMRKRATKLAKLLGLGTITRE
jgi:glycosyltransferase involved in cell wall biosynthesis